MSADKQPVQEWNADRYAEHAHFVPTLGQAVLDLLNPRPGERILDLGCGDGLLTEKIAAAGATVVGVDGAADMVAAAQKRGLDARLMDGLSLSFGREFDAVFDNVDTILAPTLPTAAPRIGEREVIIGGEKETVRSALVRLNRPANLTGHPAISIPCGFTRSGLPIGLQLIGPRWSEARLLSIALAYEDATEWHKRRPQLA